MQEERLLMVWRINEGTLSERPLSPKNAPIRIEIKIGFNLSESLVSNFLMYGTPRHEPPMAAVPGLYDAVYGRKTQIAITYLQREAIEKWIERNMG